MPEVEGEIQDNFKDQQNVCKRLSGHRSYVIGLHSTGQDITKYVQIKEWHVEV